MAVPSVSIEKLSKKYRIGAAREDYRTLRDRLAGAFRPKRQERERREIWALREIDFDIPEGEAVGLIGHNGAGKSTLLKILSRITEPTEGRAVLRGRVASLLEVGTGFHPELTGRENIFLNGAILGMSRDEIRRNFDAIVEFAEIGRFLDTPVKRYSSGMYVRLAFAVAAHLTPEILLVDEVLAVGDIEFQRRCLGRMNEVARSGRTVVFVSHNLESIERLCSRAALLRGGKLVASGPAAEVVRQYLSSRTATSDFELSNVQDRRGSGRARIAAIQLLSYDGEESLDALALGRGFRVRMQVDAREAFSGAVIGLSILSPRDERIAMTSTAETGDTIEIGQGLNTYECLLDSPPLLPGEYSFEFWVSDPANRQDGFADHLRLVGRIDVVPGSDFEGNVAALAWPDRGYMYLRSRWRMAE